jgi:hypothetical protein
MELKEIAIGISCVPIGLYMIYKFWPYDSKKSLFKLQLFLTGIGFFIIGILMIFRMLLTI